MKAYPIEDTIIAYFDGQLNDAEGAELLHRVSVSPEIREIFEEHDALRQMAVRAAQRATIAPELEESLFRRIEELQEEETRPIGFWTARRISVAAGTMALILAAMANSFDHFSGSSSTANAAKAAAIATQFNIASASLESASLGKGSPQGRPSIYHTPKIIGGPERTRNNAAPADEVAPALVMRPDPRTADPVGFEVPTGGALRLQSPEDLLNAEGPSRFEVQFSAPMSGFMLPASAPSQVFFADQSISVSYNLDERNQVGLRLTRGNFDRLRTVSVPVTNEGFTSVTGQLAPQVNFTEEIFYRHREPLSSGLFFVVGGVGGGLYSLGNVLSAEIGIQVPFGNRFLGGVSLVADRLHQNGPSPNAMMDASKGPVLYSGSSEYNTLIGNIEYALIYQF